jgi:hypothetical protein
MKVLLTFSLAIYESIGPWAANANIGTITTCNLIVASAAENAVISAESVNHIYSGTAQDQVVAFSAS